MTVVLYIKSILNKLRSSTIKDQSSNTSSITQPNISAKIMLINQVDTKVLISQVSKLYLKQLLERVKAELETRYKDEDQKKDVYETLTIDKHSNTHVIILENMAILQTNLTIIKTALSQIDDDSTSTQNLIAKQLGLKDIIDIKINKKK